MTPTPTAASDLREAAILVVNSSSMAMNGRCYTTPIKPMDQLRAALAASPASKPDEAPDVVAKRLPEPKLTCPEIDRILAQHPSLAPELEDLRNSNSQLRYGLWHEAERADEASAALQSERRKREWADRRIAEKDQALEQCSATASALARDLDAADATIASQADTIAELREAYRLKELHADSLFSKNNRLEATIAEQRAAVERAAEDEREACARIADDEDQKISVWGEDRNTKVSQATCVLIASAIRARASAEAEAR